MTNRPPDPATLIGSRVNSAELEYDYGKALSIELDEYDYFRYQLKTILVKEDSLSFFNQPLLFQ